MSKLAKRLYEEMASFPIISPHGHVEAKLLADNENWHDAIQFLKNQNSLDDIDFWYVFMLRNRDIIIDPIWDFTEDKKIYIPKLSTILQALG